MGDKILIYCLLIFFSGAMAGFFLCNICNNTQKLLDSDKADTCPYCGYYLDEED